MLKNAIQKYWLLLFFLVLFAFMAIFRISFKDVWKNILTLTFWQVALLLGLYFVISIFHIYSRKYLLYAQDHTCRLRNLTYIHFSSLAAHYSTPAKIGFPLAVYLLKKFENVPYAHGTAVILIELAVSTVICGVVAIAGGFYYFEEHSHHLLRIFLILLAAGIALAAGLWLAVKKISGGSRLKKFISNMKAAFSMVTVRHLLVYALMMIFIQLFSSLTLVLLCHFFSAQLSIGRAITAGSTAFFIGAVSMMPMGLGTRDASLLFYLKLFGISGAVGITIVAIQRLLSTGLSFVLGMIFSAVLGLKNITAQNHLDATENST
jgi:uncharacterized protein (TIRG00374 family)